MASAEGSIIPCSRNNLPEPILDYIFHLAEASIADARAFSLVCRAWLVPARTVLFREVTVLAERGYHSAVTGNATKVYPDGREITLYPRCMAVKTFTQLANCTSHLLSSVQVLKTSNDDLVRFLSSSTPNGSLQRIRELWLSDMTSTVSADVDFHRLFEHFPALRALRIQNLRGARPSKDTDIFGVERAGPVSVRMVGCVSLALRYSLAGSRHSRIVELSICNVYPVQTFADGHVTGVVRKHADTLTSVNFYMPYFAMGNAHIFTSIVPVLDECRVLTTLHLECVKATETAQITALLKVPRLDPELEHLCSGMDELLAPRAQLQTVALLIPCAHWNCPRQIKRNMPHLRLRTDVELRVSILRA